jgi:hypothetical protein
MGKILIVRSQYSSVIVTKLQLSLPQIQPSILIGGRDFPLHPTLSDFGAHAGHYILKDSGSNSHRVRAPGHEADRSPLYIAEIKMHGVLSPLPHLQCTMIG